MADFDEIGMPGWGEAPARACVESRLASPDFAVEIGIIAAV